MLKTRFKEVQNSIPGKNVEQIMEEFRWDGGSWQHFGIFEGLEFPEVSDAREALEEAGAEEILQEDFVEMVCRAALRLARSGAFDAFKSRCDFRILCVYHSETIEEGNAGLEKVRSKMG
ncbi:MAG: hypothetical protein ACI9G1_000837 [Pirellulaceae bacterium]|jgi:hypothetical protein